MLEAAPTDPTLPSFTRVFVFGDSLVDAGNALQAAEVVAKVASTPDGAPLASEGYFQGRFSDGYAFPDLISNKFVLAPTEPTFPFGFRDPVFGIELPFTHAPTGPSLNFAYGGAQAIHGGELVPDLGDQVSAYRELPGVNPNALYVVTIGGNDVRALVPLAGAPVAAPAAEAQLAAVATEIRTQVGHLVEAGARHILVTGAPDVGLLPDYTGSENEAGRRALASQYSHELEGLTTTALNAMNPPPGTDLREFSLIDYGARLVADPASYGLTNTTQARTDVQQGALQPTGSGFLFFDEIHPSAQVHALFAGAILDSYRGSAAAGDFRAAAGPALLGDIGAPGQIEQFSASLVAGRSYTVDLLGVSSGSGSLADPRLAILDPRGALVATDDDAGLGLDAHLQLTPTVTGDYLLDVSGVGVAAGSYRLQVADASGAPLLATGGVGAAHATVAGTDAADTIVAPLGSNSISGAAGDDQLTAGAGADTLNGNTGQDTLHGGGGSDVVYGGQGDDVVYGDAGDDPYLNGNIGNDQVFGGDGSDTMFGGQGQDTLFGGAGGDQLSGDLGNDILFGGPGADRFLFRSGGGIDWVGDFNPDEGDRVSLPSGAAYSVTNLSGQVLISVGPGGDAIGLAGVRFETFSPDWVVFS